MKKILITLVILLSPLIANAQITATWRATSTTQGTIFPNKINNTEQSVMATFFTATSTTGTSTFASHACGGTSHIGCIGDTGASNLWAGNFTSGAITTSISSIGNGMGLRTFSGVQSATLLDQDSGLIGNFTDGTTLVTIAGNGYGFYASGGPKYVFLNGNLGIGTTSPFTTFAVTGKSHFKGTNNDDFIIETGATQHAASIFRTGGTGVHLSLNDVTSGFSTSDGFDVGLDTTGDAIIRNRENSALRFYTNTNEKAVLTAAGNFGIGTTSPYKMLSVAGEVLANNFTATSTTATSTFNGGLIGPNALLTVQSSTGKVGIGTTSPSSILTVSDTSSVVDLIRVVGKSSGGNETYFPLNIYNSVMQPLISFGGSSSEGATDDYGYISMKGQPTSAGGIAGDFNVSNTAATPIGNDDKRLMTLRTIRGNEDTQGSINLVLRDSDTTFRSNVFSATYLGGFGTNIAEPAASLHANATSSASIVSMFQGASSQTNDLTRWVDSNQSTLSVVNNNGWLGIGTTTPYAPLSVAGQAVVAYLTSTSTTATSSFMGPVGIGTTTPLSTFAVQGSSSGSATKGTCFRAKDVGAGTFTYWWYKAGVQTTQTASCSGAGTTTVTYD